jgi:cyclopropane fatty-acyl-phospholipid synthase-like methyltransferase
MMSSVLELRDYWEKEYENTATPFDVDEPDEWVAALVASGKIYGNVLDSGCGPGRTSLYLADMGYSVLGVDLATNAIERARRKAAERHSGARFLQANMCRLSGHDNCFDTVVDIGCFHSLHENDRGRYAAALHWACRAGAVVYLRAFSDKNPEKRTHLSGLDLPALSEEQIRNAFSSNGWMVKELVEREVELFIPEMEAKPTKSCWFAEMRCA